MNDNKQETSLENLISKLDKRTAIIGIVGLGYVGLPLMLRYAWLDQETKESLQAAQFVKTLAKRQRHKIASLEISAPSSGQSTGDERRYRTTNLSPKISRKYPPKLAQESFV